jgi:ATP/ADP translocase
MKEGEKVNYSNPTEVNYNLYKNEVFMAISGVSLIVFSAMASEFFGRAGYFSQAEVSALTHIYNSFLMGMSGLFGAASSTHFARAFDGRREIVKEIKNRSLPTKGIIFRRVRN